MDVYLVRHAHAGSRQSGHHDKYRQLSEKGHARAATIAELFASTRVGRIISSTATRCVQTVEPLAASKGLDVIESEDLWEGSSIDDALALLVANADHDLVACSHGDIIPELLDTLGANGTKLKGHGCEKGSVWVVTYNGKRWTTGRKVNKHAEAI